MLLFVTLLLSQRNIITTTAFAIANSRNSLLPQLPQFDVYCSYPSSYCCASRTTTSNRHQSEQYYTTIKSHPCHQIPPSFFSLSSSYFDFGGNCYDEDDNDEEEDSSAQSEFGTRRYWQEMYAGRGDFDAKEYQWYYGWEDKIKRYWHKHVSDKDIRVLLPGIGNDPLSLQLYTAGWKDLIMFDYSSNAIARQRDILYDVLRNDDEKDPGGWDDRIREMDARALDPEWTELFDVVLEKGALDAIYLSCGDDDGLVDRENIERAVKELHRVLRKGGICMSFSGVVPEEVRRELFGTDEWDWVRDGSQDLQAGCFIWKKR